MINYDEIGLRIMMARKRRRLSQERVAEDLGLYQADISNLEKNKKGSGITDLSRLEMIADYFNMPLTQLLLGISGTDVEQGKDANEMTNEEKIAKYKELLSIESMFGNPQDWDEDDARYFADMRKQLEELRGEIDNDDYENWKPGYIEEEYQRLRQYKHLITIRFEGSEGQSYQETTAQGLVLAFLKEIDEREDLKFVGLDDATEEETKQFIAETAWDEDYRNAYFGVPYKYEPASSESSVDIPEGADEELPFNE